MGWSGGVLKGSCAALTEEGRGLGEEPRTPPTPLPHSLSTPSPPACTDSHYWKRKGRKDREDWGRQRVRQKGVTLKAVFFSSDIQCFPNDTNMKSSIYSIYTVYIEESTGAGQNWFLSGCTPCKHVVLTGHAHWHAHSLAHKHTHIHTYFGNIGTLVPLRSSSRLQNI